MTDFPFNLLLCLMFYGSCLVGPEDEIPRAHSNVSLDGLYEAVSDDSDGA